jgi:hypothetical protein
MLSLNGTVAIMLDHSDGSSPVIGFLSLMSVRLLSLPKIRSKTGMIIAALLRVQNAEQN